MKRWRAVGGAALILAAATTVGASAAPRPAGLKPDATSPEAGLWELSDKAEQHARRSAELNGDPALNAYVHRVACTVAAEYCSELRVYVLDRPFFNAQMAPNGYTEVWSGLLLRCVDEAELAFVLGHETSHFAERHSIERLETRKNNANVALAATVVVAIVGVAAAARAPDVQSAQNISNATNNLIDAVYLSSIGAYFRFSREQEAQADDLGLRRASAAGYRASAAPESWRELIGETGASDFEKVRKADTRLGIFDSHPLTVDRIKALQAEADTLPASGRSDREAYRAAIRPFLGPWLKDDLRRRDYGETLHVIDRLAASGEDVGVLSFYRGEAYRLRAKDGDALRARDAYALAAQHDDGPVAAWRELGEAQRRAGDTAAARTALETYLQRAPQAEDAWMVRETLDTLNKGT